MTTDHNLAKALEITIASRLGNREPITHFEVVEWLQSAAALARAEDLPGESDYNRGYASGFAEAKYQYGNDLAVE